MNNALKKHAMILILMSGSLFSSSLCFSYEISHDQKLMHEAKAYFEAGEYTQAIDRYQSILQGSLESWQRAIIMYDLSIVWLAAGDWNQSLETFKSVPLDNHLAPLLNARIQRNTMLAYLLQGINIARKTPDDPKALELMNKVIELAPQVDLAHCDLQKAEGIKTCTNSFDVNRMKLIAQEYLAKFLKGDPKYHLAHIQLKEGLEELFQAATDASINARFLDEHQIPDKLRKRYRSLYLKEQEESSPFWSELKQKLKNDNQKGSEERMQLMNSAANKFSQGQSQFYKKQFAKSSEDFEASANDLKELISKLPPPPPSESSSDKNKPDEQTQTPSEPSQAEMQSKQDQVIQLLLQMEQEDRAPKINQPVRKKELRPW